MSATLNGMFSKPKPHKIDFIKENKRKLKEISSMVNQNQTKSRFDDTKSKSSQTDVHRGSSHKLKENKSLTPTGFKVSGKNSMAVFLQEKKEKSISNVSLTPKQKSSQKVAILKNQSCQTIDPRRCDQLFHEGTIKYPSNKILQEIAEIEKQKANRLDAHIKKEYFKRNKLKVKTLNKIIIPKIMPNVTGKGDAGDELNPSDSEEQEEREEEEAEEVQEATEKKKESETPKNLPKGKDSPQPLNLRAAEIIRKTTEDHITYNPKIKGTSEHVPNNKGDSKATKKGTKKKDDEILKAILDSDCPPGHIPLPDSERKKTLHMLRVSYAELIREMNLLPVRTDTLRVRQRKIQLENQLNKIEEGIKVFNKSRVYVKIEE